MKISAVMNARRTKWLVRSDSPLTSVSLNCLEPRTA